MMYNCVLFANSFIIFLHSGGFASIIHVTLTCFPSFSVLTPDFISIFLNVPDGTLPLEQSFFDNLA